MGVPQFVKDILVYWGDLSDYDLGVDNSLNDILQDNSRGEHFAYVVGAEAETFDNGSDDFFSQYQSIVEDGIVGSRERLQVQQDLAVQTAPQTEDVFPYDSNEEGTVPWMDDFPLP